MIATRKQLLKYNFEFCPNLVEKSEAPKGATGIAYNEYELWYTDCSNPEALNAVYERLY